MTLASVRLRSEDGELAAALAEVRVDLGVSSDFPADVEAEAAFAASTIALPDIELLDAPFITIDPADSMDLDQAMQLEPRGNGYTVRYAIADVPAFVAPGGAIDRESRRRGQTLYPPDGRIPLHPVILSENAASLLPGKVRGAFVWTFQLDSAARVTSTTLVRARVRSTARYDYDRVQELMDSGSAPEGIALLKEIGVKRIALERERGGASLGRPEQEIHEAHGRYVLTRRRPLPAESWNAQISLMTGMAAANIMLEGHVGILRTMPAPGEEAIAWFRRRAAALGTPWEPGTPYGEYLRRLDPNVPHQLAIMHAAASLFRGAGYTAFDGQAPHDDIQSAVAAPYAHATAPLRRLVDRFVLVVCEALANKRTVPEWARTSLPELPALMAASDNLAGRLENETTSRVEAAILHSRVGENFDATVLAATSDGGQIQVDDPAVTAPCAGSLTPGDRVSARLLKADIATGEVGFAVDPRGRGASANANVEKHPHTLRKESS